MTASPSGDPRLLEEPPGGNPGRRDRIRAAPNDARAALRAGEAILGFAERESVGLTAIGGFSPC